MAKLTSDQLLKLSDQGWTKDEILKMFGGGKHEEPKKEPDPGPKSGAGEGKEKTVEEMLKAFTDSINGSIAGLTKTIQASNLLNAGGAGAEEEDASDILAGILPNINDEEEDK